MSSFRNWLILCLSLSLCGLTLAEAPNENVIDAFVRNMAGEQVKDGIRLAIYIPDETRDGEEFDPEVHQRWVQEAGRLLAKLGGGFTIYEARGGWVDPETNRLDWEHTSVLYWTIPADVLRASAEDVKEFLYRYGRETDQSAVAFEVDGELCIIDHSHYLEAATKEMDAPAKDPLFIPVALP